MILALCLVAVGVTVSSLAPALLVRWTSAARSPLAALAAWQFASWLVLATVLLAATLLAVPSLAAAGRLPADVESCLSVLRGLPNPADSRAVQALATAVLVCALVRLSGCAVRSSVTNHRRRARHRILLRLVGTPDVAIGAHIVPDPTALVYCVPGQGGRVVFTSAAVEQLTLTQRAAVLAHERAHLRGRHHLLIASASVLARAFPRILLFRTSFEHTTQLVEMRADDLASRGCGGRPVADALLVLAEMTSSPTVLAASAVTTAHRIARLLSDQPPRNDSGWTRVHRVVGACSAAALLAVSPVLLTAAGHAAMCLL